MIRETEPRQYQVKATVPHYGSMQPVEPRAGMTVSGGGFLRCCGGNASRRLRTAQDADRDRADRKPLVQPLHAVRINLAFRLVG
jgi:hypothetical protein